MDIKQKAKLAEPSVRIGKNGVTENIIKEVSKKAKKDGFVKVKFLRTAIEEKDKKKLFEEIAELSGTQIIHSVGFVVCLGKKTPNNLNKAKTI